MRKVVISRVTPRDWLALRELRLRALSSDPLSFGSTYDREAGFSDEDWREWASGDSLGDAMATLIAKHEHRPIGIVGAYRDETDPVLFHIIAMWVDPDARGEGIGRQLLAHIEGWIRSCNGRAVQLHVTTTASAARRLYETAGFEPDGDRRDSSHTPGLAEVSLRKTLL